MRPLNVEMGHWLVFNAEREVVRCHCGFEADVATDSGYGDSVVDHLLSINLDARDRARGIAVALEQRLAAVERLHFPFFWRIGATSTDDRRIEGESDGSEGASSTLCSHCRDLWPCPTLNAARGNEGA